MPGATAVNSRVSLSSFLSFRHSSAEDKSEAGRGALFVAFGDGADAEPVNAICRSDLQLNFLADLGVNLSRIELKIFGGHRNYALDDRRVDPVSAGQMPGE